MSTALAEAATVASIIPLGAARAAAQIVLTLAKMKADVLLAPHVVSNVSQSTPAVSREPLGGAKSKNQFSSASRSG